MTQNVSLIPFFKSYHLPLKDQPVVAAVSGGPDSMALLDLLVEAGARVIAAHVDHQLRADSADESRLLKAYCAARQVKLVETSWPKDLHPATGIEAAARDFRYAFLVKTAKEAGANYILTAHHGDDLAENELIKFIRSGKPQEMNSLQRSGQIHGVKLLRPLLDFSKAELLAYDQQRGLSYILDQTNTEDDTLRNRLRHHVMPQLKRESPQLIAHAGEFSREMTALTAWAIRGMQQIVPESYLDSLRVKSLNLSPTAEFLYWQYQIKTCFNEQIGHFGRWRLVHKAGYDYLIPPAVTEARKKIEPNQPFAFAGRHFCLRTSRIENEDTAWQLLGTFQADGSDFAAGVLPAGLKLNLKNGQHAKAKKKFADHGVPGPMRSHALAIFCANQAVFVEKCYQNQVFSENSPSYWLYYEKNI
ncbi:tRNA lysidine(34) synthetase TilS [Lactobacillus corticis]|nr:tRNA lysidine(34) synthetase TilS [Lactobacillus corticis]